MITLAWEDRTQLIYVLNLARSGLSQGIAVCTQNNLTTLCINNKDGTLVELKEISVLLKLLFRTYQTL